VTRKIKLGILGGLQVQFCMNFLQKYTILKHFVRSRLDAIRPRCDFLSKSPLPQMF